MSQQLLYFSYYLLINSRTSPDASQVYLCSVTKFSKL